MGTYSDLSTYRQPVFFFLEKIFFLISVFLVVSKAQPLERQDVQVQGNETHRQRGLKTGFKYTSYPTELVEAMGSVKATINLGKVYVLVGGERQTWEQARAECRRRGGDLAVLATFKEIDLVTKEMLRLQPREAKYVNVWVGASRKSTNRNPPHKFAWITGEEIAQDFGYWKQGEPDAQWAVGLTTGTRKGDGSQNSVLASWDKDDDRNVENFLCEMS